VERQTLNRQNLSFFSGFAAPERQQGLAECCARLDVPNDPQSLVVATKKIELGEGEKSRIRCNSHWSVPAPTWCLCATNVIHHGHARRDAQR
jgi:hypothetical protein